ncbi:MAG: DegT/DnrJ/EryC1/StrS family aminotransferase [Bacteroidetes bacterium]|nr:DegT/DnrJ/EryC1/StrS family aminotransferase [Bacteroidota bacterium]
MPVSKPYIPSLEEYNIYLKDIWERKWLTNNGPLVRQLEQNVPIFLDSVPMSYVTNGTIALQLALRALEISGEVITTPYSYVATTSAILWENCTPVFVDCKFDGNINEDLIEQAITSSTKAILATHVYGFPCNVEKIQAIAVKFNLKVIYDAAHAFGVKFNEQSIFNYGDISTSSYHATKLFHTIEGGGIFSSNPDLIKQINLLKSFGHVGDEHFILGINGKQSELHAAMGLCVIKHVSRFIKERKLIYERYREVLSDKVEFVFNDDPRVSWNYAYAPIILKNEEHVKETVIFFEENKINIRRYFYPSLNQLPYLNSEKDLPVSNNLASRVVCLPIYNGMSETEIQRVSNCIEKWL